MSKKYLAKSWPGLRGIAPLRWMGAIAIVLGVMAIFAAGSFELPPSSNSQTDAAIPQESTDVLKVMFTGEPDYVTTYREVAKRFEAANPGVRMEMIYVPHDDFDKTVNAAVKAKRMPDILQVDSPFMANYAWSGHLVPITPYIDKDIIDDMTESAISNGVYPIDGKLYGVGLTDSTVVLYGNRKYLSAIGARIPKGVSDAWSAEEFQSYLQKLSTVPGVKWPLDIWRSYGANSEWITYAYSPALQSAGCDLIDRTKWTSVGTLDSTPCVKVLSMWQEWVKKGWIVPSSEERNAPFIEQNAALLWGGNWACADAAKAMGDNMIVMPLPKFGPHSASPNGTWIWSITKASAKPKLAGKFLSFFLKDAKYREFANSRSEFPGLYSFASMSPLFSANGTMGIGILQSEKTAIARPAHPAYPIITSVFMSTVEAIFNGADAQQKLTEAATQIDRDIAKKGGYPPFNRRQLSGS